MGWTDKQDARDTYPLLTAAINQPETQVIRQIALDLDDTIFPILEAVQPWSDRQLDYSLISEHGKLIEYLGGKEKAEQAFLQAFTFQRSSEVGLFPGAKQGLQRLADYNILIHVMTHRPNAAYADTKKFLRLEEIPFASLYCQSPIDKLALCRRHGISVLVDDKDSLMIEAINEGIKPLALTLPYNQQVIHDLCLPQAHNWNQLTEHILATIEKHLSELEENN